MNKKKLLDKLFDMYDRKYDKLYREFEKTKNQKIKKELNKVWEFRRAIALEMERLGII